MTSEERRQKNLQRLQVFTLMDDQRAGVGSRFALPRGWFGHRSRWSLSEHTALGLTQATCVRSLVPGCAGAGKYGYER